MARDYQPDGSLAGVIAAVASGHLSRGAALLLVREAPGRISRSARRLTGSGFSSLDAEYSPIARELVCNRLRYRADQHFSAYQRRRRNPQTVVSRSGGCLAPTSSRP